MPDFEATLISDLELLLRVFLAFTLAIPIGLERERRERPAGLRTHMLLCGSAALFVGLAEVLLEMHGSLEGARIDPVRAIEAIAAGIGFLGAGTIIVHGKEVLGLTTAASVLATAAIGASVGAGRYVLGSGACLLVVVTLAVLRKLEPRVTGRGE